MQISPWYSISGKPSQSSGCPPPAPPKFSGTYSQHPCSLQGQGNQQAIPPLRRRTAGPLHRIRGRAGRARRAPAQSLCLVVCVGGGEGKRATLRTAPLGSPGWGSWHGPSWPPRRAGREAGHLGSRSFPQADAGARTRTAATPLLTGAAGTGAEQAQRSAQGALCAGTRVQTTYCQVHKARKNPQPAKPPRPLSKLGLPQLQRPRRPTQGTAASYRAARACMAVRNPAYAVQTLERNFGMSGPTTVPDLVVKLHPAAVSAAAPGLPVRLLTGVAGVAECKAAPH